jgi:hypothetical protein
MFSFAKGLSFWQSMKRTSLVLPHLLIAALILLWVRDARAWDGFGHMQIAEIAWTGLDAPTRARVGQLLKLNPQYAQWTAGVPAGEQDHIAFVTNTLKFGLYSSGAFDEKGIKGCLAKVLFTADIDTVKAALKGHSDVSRHNLSLALSGEPSRIRTLLINRV